MSTLGLHLRTCPVRWSLPILAALDVAILFLRNRYWIGIWPEAGAAAQVSTYLLGPLVAGAAAWSAGAPVRHGLTEQLGAARISPARLNAYRLGATIIVLTAPYLIGQAVAFTTTAVTFPSGVHLWAGYGALGLFVTLLTIAIGWLIGKVFTSLLATLTAVIGTLVLLGMLDRGLNAIVVSGPPQVEANPGAIAIRLLLTALVLAALLRVRSAHQPPARGATATAVAALSLVIIVMYSTTIVADRPPAGNHVICVNGTTALCIWPEHETYVPLLHRIDDRLATLPPSFRFPARVDEFGIQPTGHTVNGTNVVYVISAAQLPTFSILVGSPWSIAGDVSNAVLDTTFGFDNATACTWSAQSDSDGARIEAVGAWLESYLAGDGAPDYTTDAPQQVQDAWALGRAVACDDTRTEQLRWADDEVTGIRGRYCH